MKVRKAIDRGEFENNWLKAKYTFSFSHYYDPAHMGFHHLRVINNDIIAAGGGFPTHSHKDMEILTFILSGELAHKDSMGNSAIIKPGMIQIMSAGSGVTHSEFNPSEKNSTELFQIWLIPKKNNITPSYSEFNYTDIFKKNELNLIASGQNEDNVGLVNQDARLFYFEMNEQKISINKNRNYWLQLIEGEIGVGEKMFTDRDAISFERERQIVNVKKAKGLLFEF